MEIRVSASLSETWTLDAAAQLQGTDVSNDLFIVTRHSPLILDEVQAAPPCKVTMPAKGSPPIVQLSREKTSSRGWSDTELALRFRWCPPKTGETAASVGHQEFDAPCLVLPDMLPRLATEASIITLAPPPRLPRIFFADELPPELNAGGVAVPDRKRRGTPELLQTVIFPAADGAPDLNDVVVTESTARNDGILFDQVYRYVAPLVEYLSEELGPLPVRPVICLSDSSTTYPPTGAYCPISYEAAGAREKNSGLPVHLIRLLAQAWIAGGVRLWGENASNLALAVGGALGLRWLGEQGHDAYLNKMLAEMESIAKKSEERERRPAEEIREMELSFFNGLANAKTRSRLRGFVRERWGEFVPQDEFITFLRKQGVAVPHVFA